MYKSFKSVLKSDTVLLFYARRPLHIVVNKRKNPFFFMKYLHSLYGHNDFVVEKVE